ncbi:MAG: efflux RND transporter permease subunit [Myxococcota bacterium]|nr:efflux RND transporter permease subunit [Myxococcota bacterium]
MIAGTVAWSTRHSWTVIALAVLLALVGELSRRSLARDAVPDLSDPQIVLMADWMGHPATEVATAVTDVLTDALEGVPGSRAVRGSSMSGMAWVDVVFASASSVAGGRRAIVERVAEARRMLPANVRIQIGPEASSNGWVFQYALFDPSRVESPLTLRRFQDEVLRPALASVPDVAEVASVGGEAQQVVVEAQPEQLRAKGLALTDVISALRSALPAGNPTIEGLEALPVGGPPAGGKLILLRDVARIRTTDDMPAGLADFSDFEAVGGIVIARRGADLSSVIDGVVRTLVRERARLAPEVRIVSTYNRLDLANRVEQTLIRALGEEVTAVVLIVLIFLLHGRSAFVPLITLPFVMLLTFAAMWILHIPATVMSLGGIAIALGMAVDADVVALEACHRRLETMRKSAPMASRRAAILAGAGSIAPAIVTSLVITAITFLPVFAFSGEAGRLLRPLALTKTLVIASAVLVTATLAPALRARLLVGRITPEFENPLTRGLLRLYRPFVHFALRRPAFTLITAALAVLSCLPIVSRLGGEFFPRIDEGDLLFMPTTLPGVSAEQALAQLRRQDRAIAAFPEVATVFGKVGRADTATDPAPFSMGETTIRLRPRDSWPRIHRVRWYSAWAPKALRDLLRFVWPEETAATSADLVERLDRATRLPGWTNAWTAPARARMDMMSTGVRTPVGIRLVARDPTRLDALGNAVRTIAMRVPGTRSAVFESMRGETWLDFAADPAALALHGVDPALVQSTASFLLTGAQVGELDLAGRRLRVRVAPEPDDTMGGLAERIRNVTVRAGADASGQPVPLGLLGHPTYVNRPSQLRTEGGHPVAYVYVDLIEGTDLLGYVGRARQEIARAVATQELRFDTGERIEWTGQYEPLVAGQRRLMWIVPLVVVTMLGLLFVQFRSVIEALIVFLAVPFALVGSFWTLFLLGYPLSAPVWAGLLSVVGLAMQTGVVMVVYIDDAFHRRVREGALRDRDDVIAAHAEGTIKRLRPKIMTIATMGAALLPLFWAEGAGAEIMKRVAAPMIGGLATSAFLTLEVLPVLYTIWRCRQLRQAQRSRVPIEAIVGAVPAWSLPEHRRGDSPG